MSEILQSPKPFVVSLIDLNDDGKPSPSFSAGICLTTESYSGLKLVPTHEVCFEIKDGEKKSSLAIPAKFARDLATELLSYADTCDQLNSRKQ